MNMKRFSYFMLPLLVLFSSVWGVGTAVATPVLVEYIHYEWTFENAPHPVPDRFNGYTFIAANESGYTGDLLSLINNQWVEFDVFLPAGNYAIEQRPRIVALHQNHLMSTALYDDDGGLVCTGTFNRDSPSLVWQKSNVSGGSCIVSGGEYVFRVHNSSTTTSVERHRYRLAGLRIVQTDYNPTPPAAPLYQSSCHLAINPSGAVISATDTLTNMLGITGTVAISDTTVITVPANLLANGGFEQAATVVPDNWRFVTPLYAPSLRQLDNNLNSYVMRSENTVAMEMWQDVFIPESPAFQVGAFVDFPDSLGDGVQLGVDNTLVEFGAEPFGYIPRDDVIELPSGEGQFRAILPDTTPALVTYAAIDDVYLVPVEVDPETGEVLGVYCAAVGEHYENTNGGNDGEIGTGTGGTGGTKGPGYYVPNVPAGTCLNCPELSGMGALLSLGLNGLIRTIFLYAGFFQCLLSNIFLCEIWGLFVELINLVAWIGYRMVDGLNWFIGVVGTVTTAFFGMAQNILDWSVTVYLALRNVLGTIIDWLVWGFHATGQMLINLASLSVEFVVTGVGIVVRGLNLIWQFVLFVASNAWAGALYALGLFWSLTDIIVAIFTVFWEVIVAIGEVLLADPMGIEEWADGASINSVALAMFFLGISFVDTSLATLRLVSAIYLVIGGFGLYMAMRLLQEWEIILPN